MLWETNRPHNKNLEKNLFTRLHIHAKHYHNLPERTKGLNEYTKEKPQVLYCADLVLKHAIPKLKENRFIHDFIGAPLTILSPIAFLILLHGQIMQINTNLNTIEYILQLINYVANDCIAFGFITLVLCWFGDNHIASY